MTITIGGGSNQFGFSDATSQATSGKLVNIQRVTCSSRFNWGARSNYMIWAPLITKLNVNSTLLVKVNLSMRNNYSDCLIWYVQYGNDLTQYQGTQPYDAGFVANSRPYYSNFYVTGNKQVGTHHMQLCWTTANNDTGNYPAGVWNPGYVDDNRYTSEYSAMLVMEFVS